MVSSQKLLVIDDDRSIHAITRGILEADWQSLHAKSGAEGLAILEAETVDAVLLDILLPDQGGLEIYARIREIDPRLPVIFITSEGGGDVVIEAMQLGAYDYVVKPLDVQHLKHLIQKAFALRAMVSVPVAIGAETADHASQQLLIGSSPKMVEVFKAIGRVAKQDIAVLIRGETGTGKELVARAIVQHSARCDGPFLAVNCAAITETLLESELFGHEKGAFTGALAMKKGRFELADTGTLFLDEIGEMPVTLQAKLLRVLQEKQFERLGGSRTISVDVRVIAATNRSLEEAVNEGSFRADLYYRLNVVPIILPPLRERREDIPILLDHFLRESNRNNQRDVRLARPVLQFFQDYDWPGNVREMQNLIERLVIMADREWIEIKSLPSYMMEGPPAARNRELRHVDDGAILSERAPLVLAEGSGGRRRLHDLEKEEIFAALRRNGWVQARAARELGLTQRQIGYKMRKYGLERPEL